MTKERIVYIDTAKTICIFLMVLGHWTTNDVLIKYIYSFHMPALFVISGYLYKPRPWTKTLLSFGIPVAFFSLINLFFLLFIGEVKINQLISLEIFYRFFHYRYGLGEGLFCGDWFLWALLGLRLLFGDICPFEKEKRWYVILSLIAVLYMSLESYFISIDSIFRGLYIGRLIPSMPFFCFGLYLKFKKIDPQRMSIVLFILTLFVSLIVPIINGSCSINSNNYGLSYMLFFIGAVFSTIVLFKIAAYIPMNMFVYFISRGTLLILGLHIPIMRALDLFLPTSFHDLLSLFVLPLCYFPIMSLDKKFPVLLGKVG